MMRILISNILLFIYFSYLLVSSFPVFSFYLYQKITEPKQMTADSANDEFLQISDLNYLNAIKTRAGMSDDQANDPPQKISSETLSLVCILDEDMKRNDHPFHPKLSNCLYLNHYIDNPADVAVPPPKSV